MADGEAWRPIPDWEGIYEVSDEGRVRSVDRLYIDKNGRSMRFRGQIRSQSMSAGYPVVSLRNGSGKNVARKVHWLVTAAFIGPKPDGLVVRHLDGNRLNNHIENLVYGTHTENRLDSTAHGTNWQANKTHCKNGHPFDEANTIFTRKGSRRCLACKRASQTRRNHRLRGEPKMTRSAQ